MALGTGVLVSDDRTSWDPVPLAPILHAIAAGESAGPVPELMPRTDGLHLLYPGELHSLAGEPESGKGLIVCAEAVRLMTTGQHVVYLDFEDTAPSVVSRLIALGAPHDALLERLIYVQPDAAPALDAIPRLLRGNTPRLAIVDGLTEAYALLGLDAHSNTDAATFFHRLPRPIAAAGAAVVLIDHVVKDKEGRGRFALGAGHKLAGVAVAYGIDVVDRPSRTHTGKVKITLSKDRHGHIPGARGSTIAIATIAPADEGQTVTVRLDPPDSSDQAGHFRPTVLMEKVSRYVEQHPAAGRNQIREGVTGKTQAKDLALTLLVEEGWIDRQKDGQSYRHTTLRPFRKATDPGPTRTPGSDRDPTGTRAQPDPTGIPGSPPTKGARTRVPARQTLDAAHRDPDPDAELHRLAQKGLTP